AMSGDRERSLAVGVTDHVTRRIDPDALFAVLLRWVRPGEREAATRTPPPSQPEVTTRRAAAPPRIEELPGIDRATGLRRVAGNEALYGKLLLDFHRDYPASIDPVRAPIRQGRLADAQPHVPNPHGGAGI